MAKKHWAPSDLPVYIVSKDSLASADEPVEDLNSPAPEEPVEIEGSLVESWLTFELTPVLPRSPGSWVSPKRSCQRH